MVQCPGVQDNEKIGPGPILELGKFINCIKCVFFQNPGNKRGKAISTSKINLRTFYEQYGDMDSK